MILEAAVLNIKAGQSAEFEKAFAQGSPLIQASHGYIRHELRKCVETPDRYLMLIQWETLEDHVVGFRQSPAFQEWKRLTHHFYEPFPTVEHFTMVYENEGHKA